ncbi:uncharacterized protein LOC135334562 [Halichondria panicea]|uniref:uncharacterized protein LOC135334562 n=1 Tax=Halichondria panicea TaxID=6063 RepID=UPI00312BC51E
MLPRSILSWLVLLLILATVTRSEHYHIVPVDSTDLCNGYKNGTCFTLEQLVQTDLLSGGEDLTLSFLPGDHVLTEQLLISNFSYVQITSENTNTTVVGFHSNGTIRFVSRITELNIEHLSFVRANVGPQNFDQSFIIIDSAHDVYIKDCYFINFELLNQAETHIVKIANTQTATIESTLFMNNTGRALHVEADDVYITNSVFTRNDGGAIDIQSNNALINNTEFSYNSAWSGGAAVQVVSGTVVITWCNFTNNEASNYGGAISVYSGSVFIFDNELTNNRARHRGVIKFYVDSGKMSIFNSSTLDDNSVDHGVIYGFQPSLILKDAINISFQPCTCPLGLKPIKSDIECKCDCDPVLQQYQITNCSEKNGTIKLESNIWIRVANTTNRTGYVVSNCTFDYCVEKPVNISLSNPDEQCGNNRSGVLCGECEPGLSLVLATSKCRECSNLYLLLLIPFALAGILLVALVLVLNITIATGNIHGLIFYANMVAANRTIFFPNLDNFLTVFVSWVNLDLGIETCFYDGMNSQAKVLLQLVFLAYLFLLMFLIIILNKYYDSFSKLLSNRNLFAALGTLAILSYSKLLRFIVAALQYRVLNYPDDTNDIVWLYDGNVQYFTPDHIPQFVVAAIILIAGGLFTILLFFGQWFSHCSMVMKWTKNTKYIGFMDAYHAPFTPKHRYWVGLLLFALIIHNLVTAMAPDIFLPVLSSGILSLGLIGWKLLNNRLYKNTFCGSLETLYLLNIATLAFGTFYAKDIKKDQSALANTSMAISFTLFVTTLCYHFYQFILKKSNTWLRIEDTIRNLRAGAADMRLRRANGRDLYLQVANEEEDNNFLEAVDDYEQRDPVDQLYTDGAAMDQPYTDETVEETDPDRYITPTIIRPAMRPDKLRLSYMDDLAPLTTEDYRRRATPSPTVNHRPVVTHTEIGPIRDEV